MYKAIIIPLKIMYNYNLIYSINPIALRFVEHELSC